MKVIHAHRAVLAPLLTLFTILVVGLAIFFPLQGKQEKYNATIQSIQPRLERLQGMLDHSAEVQRNLEQASQAINRYFYPASSPPNQIDTELTARLRGLAQQSGMTIGGMRPLPARKEQSMDVFLLSMSLSGTVSQFQSFLHMLRQPPELWVDGLTIIKTTTAPDAPQVLSIDITIAALRRPSP
ncbi:MAG: type II secretion system protein GspM [Pseudomonadota bacterium]